MKKIITAVLTAAMLAVCVFSFSAFAEADNEQYLYKEGSECTTGWWFWDGAGMPEGKYVNIKFTAKGDVTGFSSHQYSGAAAAVKCSVLSADGTEIEAQTLNFTGDADFKVTFSKAIPAGELTIRFECTAAATGTWFVLGSSDAPDSGTVAEIETNAGTNDASKAAPFIKLDIAASTGDGDGDGTGTGDTDTPATGEASIVIAAVAAVALAGVVVCKKVRA